MTSRRMETWSIGWLSVCYHWKCMYSLFTNSFRLKLYSSLYLITSQAAQAHVLRKANDRLIHESVTRCVTRCWVTRGTVENLNTLYEIVGGNKICSFYNDRYFKYEYFTRKINKLAHILCVRCSFWRFLPFWACFIITVIPVESHNAWRFH